MMSDFDSDSFSENDWDECGDLAWNEFDWERYLREQDDVLHRYLGYYEKSKGHSERIDQVAQLMGWDNGLRASEAEERADISFAEDVADAMLSNKNFPLEPYTLHKNPVFVATKAIYLSLKRSWERLAADKSVIAQPEALMVQTSLYRGEEQAMLGVQALDLGEYAMAVSLFKRALQELNRTLALISGDSPVHRRYAAWHEDALPRLFDLREIWLRVIAECRQELDRPIDEEE